VLAVGHEWGYSYTGRGWNYVMDRIEGTHLERELLTNTADVTVSYQHLHGLNRCGEQTQYPHLVGCRDIAAGSYSIGGSRVQLVCNLPIRDYDHGGAHICNVVRIT
jgi:hypothetical protein